MEITVRRFEYHDTYTISHMHINGVYECFVLEDTVRAPGVKLKGETAIPAGVYKVVVNFSEHFQRDLPQILDVPMFEGIRIHSGNTDKDTEGCLLVGKYWTGTDMITQSRVAFTALFEKINKALADKEEVHITIVDTK